MRTDDGGPGASRPAAPPVARPALARLVGDPAEFDEQSWDRAPLLCPRADASAFGDLLTAAAVDELVSERGLRTPFLRVARAGTTLPARAFTAPGGVGAGIADQVSDHALSALFAEGSTLVLQALHRVWPPVVDFCQQLAADLGHPVQANAYVTPPQNQGFDDHYDVHDVFVLQVAGRKRWSIHAPVLPAPLRDQPWTDHAEAVRRAAQEPPVVEAVLEPGDALYLPRGYLHSATALGGVSIHLTLGVHVWTRWAVAEELVALALERMSEYEAARRSLGVGTDLAGDQLDLTAVRGRLGAALDAVEPDEVADRLRARRRSAQRPAPVGPLAQHALAASLTDDTRLRLREHLDASLDSSLDADVLRSRAGDTDVADVPREVLARLLAGATVTAGDLGADVARRLVGTGVVVAG